TDLHQAGHRYFFDLAEAAEVDGRNRRNAGPASRSVSVLALLQPGLDVRLDVFLEDASFRAGALDLGQIDAELARRHANCGARMNLAASLARSADHWRCLGRCFSWRHALLVRC